MAASHSDVEMLMGISTPTAADEIRLVKGTHTYCHVKLAHHWMRLIQESGRVVLIASDVLKACDMVETHCDSWEAPTERVRVVLDGVSRNCLTLAGFERLIREKPNIAWLQSDLMRVFKTPDRWPMRMSLVAPHHCTLEGTKVAMYRLAGDNAIVMAAGELYRAACHYYGPNPEDFCKDYALSTERIFLHPKHLPSRITCLTAAGVERAIREKSQIKLHQADLRRAMSDRPPPIAVPKQEDPLVVVATAASELPPDEFALRTVNGVRFVRSLAGQVLVVARDARPTSEKVDWCRHMRSPEERVRIRATGINGLRWTMCLTHEGVERAIREKRISEDILTAMNQSWQSPERKREREEEEEDDKPLAPPPKKIRLPEGFRTRDQLVAHVANQIESLMARATEAQRAVSADGVFRVLITEHDTLASITQFLTTMVSPEVGFRHVPNPSTPHELVFSL